MSFQRGEGLNQINVPEGRLDGLESCWNRLDTDSGLENGYPRHEGNLAGLCEGFDDSRRRERKKGRKEGR